MLNQLRGKALPTPGQLQHMNLGLSSTHGAVVLEEYAQVLPDGSVKISTERTWLFTGGLAELEALKFAQFYWEQQHGPFPELASLPRPQQAEILLQRDGFHPQNREALWISEEEEEEEEAGRLHRLSVRRCQDGNGDISQEYVWLHTPTLLYDLAVLLRRKLEIVLPNLVAHASNLDVVGAQIVLGMDPDGDLPTLNLTQTLEETTRLLDSLK